MTLAAQSYPLPHYIIQWCQWDICCMLWWERWLDSLKLNYFYLFYSSLADFLWISLDLWQLFNWHKSKENQICQVAKWWLRSGKSCPSWQPITHPPFFSLRALFLSLPFPSPPLNHPPMPACLPRHYLGSRAVGIHCFSCLATITLNDPGAEQSSFRCRDLSPTGCTLWKNPQYWIMN